MADEAESVACQVDEDGGVCGLDSCPRCRVLPAEYVALRQLIVAERKALTTRATTDLVYTEGYDDALVWVLDRIDFPRLNDGQADG